MRTRQMDPSTLANLRIFAFANLQATHKSPLKIFFLCAFLGIHLQMRIKVVLSEVFINCKDHDNQYHTYLCMSLRAYPSDDSSPRTMESWVTFVVKTLHHFTPYIWHLYQLSVFLHLPKEPYTLRHA